MHWDKHARKLCGASSQEVPNAAWQAHTYISYGDPGKGVPNQILLYGDPENLKDFCDLAQIVNFVQYRHATFFCHSPMLLLEPLSP